MVSYGSSSFAATDGVVTAVSISSLGVSDGCAASECDSCSVTVSCPGVGSPNPEQIIQGSLSGFAYMPTTVAEPARAPSTFAWVACPSLNVTEGLQGSPAATFRKAVPPGAARVAWLPDNTFTMSSGSALLVLSAAKRSSF